MPSSAVKDRRLPSKSKFTVECRRLPSIKVEVEKDRRLPSNAVDVEKRCRNQNFGEFRGKKNRILDFFKSKMSLRAYTHSGKKLYERPGRAKAVETRQAHKNFEDFCRLLLNRQEGSYVEFYCRFVSIDLFL